MSGMLPQASRLSLVENSFLVEIDYDPEHGGAAHIFEALAEISLAFENLDTDLARCIFPEARTRLVLQQVETGSIRSFFVAVLEDVDDNDIRDLNWKRILGKFLVQCKAKILDRLKQKDKITDLQEVHELRDEVHRLAQETELNQLGAYNQLNDATLLYRIEQITTAVRKLDEGDGASYVTTEQRVEFNKDFFITKEEIQELLTEESRRQELDALLRVKKPDYLGQSRWDMHHDGHTVHVKIADEDWLEKFHERQFDLRPGDALKAKTIIEAWMDSSGTVLDSRYTAVKVYGIVPESETRQLPFDTNNDDE